MEKTIILGYHNVLFYLVINSEKDLWSVEKFAEAASGHGVCMMDVHRWCMNRNIPYRAKFFYRKDYSVKVNWLKKNHAVVEREFQKNQEMKEENREIRREIYALSSKSLKKKEEDFWETLEKTDYSEEQWDLVMQAQSEKFTKEELKVLLRKDLGMEQIKELYRIIRDINRRGL